MKSTSQLARHFREVYFGNHFATSNFKEQLQDVDWQQATTKVHSFNTIATLVFHTHYYVHAVLGVLRGGPLEGHDSLSFDHPPIESQADWDEMQLRMYADAEEAAILLEQMPDEMLWEVFGKEKYGNYFRNVLGILEHCQYHLGQIALIKKLV